MNQHPAGINLRELLDEAADAPSVPRERLRHARERALAAIPAARTVETRVAVPALAGAAGRSPGGGSSSGLLVRYLLPAAIVAAALLGWQQWQQSLRDSAEIEGIGRIDADILKSDLPVDALIDPEFKAYLRKVDASADSTTDAAEAAPDHGQTRSGEQR